MDRYDAEEVIAEIQALHFCISEFLSVLANLSVRYDKHEANTEWELAYETSRISRHMNILNGILCDKVQDLKSYIQKQEPTSSANEVSHNINVLYKESVTQ